MARCRRIAKKTLIIVCWLFFWQALCWIVNNPVFFAGPIEMAAELCRMAAGMEFWRSVMNSLIRITGGFGIAFLLACFSAVAAYRFKLLEECLSPFVAFIKTVPVASVIVLLLIWFGAKELSVYVTFMVVFPNIYINVLAGLKNTDRELLEMAELFDFTAKDRMVYIYRPAVMPYLLSGVGISVGMSFKSGVAAEVIGLPLNSIGEGLYNAKIYLNTAGVFAWTAVIILLSSLVEWLAAAFFGRLRKCGKTFEKWTKKRRTGSVDRTGGKKRGRPEEEKRYDLSLEHIAVKFGEKEVLKDLDLNLTGDKLYCLMGSSGCGKTTLLRVCAGLQDAITGSLIYTTRREGENAAVFQRSWNGDTSIKKRKTGKKRNRDNKIRIGMAFQEDRLCLGCPALVNIILAADRNYSAEEVRKLAAEILPEEALDQTTERLSGGMKRRLAVARAVLSDADILLLDEPFNGLDEENHERLLAWILRNRKNRFLMITSHDEEDALRMGAEVIRLPDGSGE